ncbi:efflux transporter outer membrane subunit [Rhodoferax sp.]|uniref:efflux transporter outer membrane subunit n=1 Tax=Rhodoferax sp. TaxID=50421 RepID=UPI0025DEAECD|nr:efflux transporter outer membrane subunit [Rhodoferax sp.]
MRPSQSPFFKRHILAMAAFSLLASGCAVGPDYQRPSAVTPAAYKEANNWVPAAPADALERGPWWTLFNDPVLNELASGIEVSNQNIAVASANYAQARALVREQRAALFPVITLNGGATKSGGGASSSRTGNTYQANIGGSWEPDVWGRLSRGVDSASASSQASAADLASARLSAQGELATNYFSIRQTDAQQALLASTIAGYQRTLQITQNRYAAGIAAKTDVLQAQTQLANAQAEALGLSRQRAQLEHAIAVLLGRAPADFTLASIQWTASVPEVPLGVPSTLLERRPDIAAAERRVAVANEQIGIAQSAFYPSVNLNASYGFSASAVSDLFSASNSLWSLGLSAAQVLFNAGATRERVSGAQAAHDAAVARYRQTVLTAFQNVEDQLAATRVLVQQQALRGQASQAADEAETQMLNRYREGQVSYTEVVTAQASALSARRALVQVQADRQTTAVALIQSLGGGW